MTGLLPLFMVAHFGHHLMMALLPPLLPFIRHDLALSYTRAGALVSAYSIAYGISQFPGGLAADRLGSRVVLAIGVAGVALAGLLVGMSPNYVFMAVMLVVMGIAGGGYHPSASPLVSASVRPEYRGRALGLHQIGGTASFFLGPLIAAAIAGALGWRGTFITVAIPTLCLGIVFYLLLGKAGYAGTPAAKGAGVPAAQPDSTDLRQLLSFVAVGIASMVLIQSTLALVPLYAVDVLGAAEEQGAALLSVAYFGGIWGGPLGGYLSDRLGRVPVIIAVGLLSGPAIYLLNHVSLGVSLYAVLLLMGTTMHVGMPVVESYIIGHVSPAKRSTVLGLYYMISRGGPTITILLGFFIDSYQFSVTLAGVSIFMTAIAIAGTVLLRGKRR
ncbi:MAG: MFS transporter [Dehalococcoidia bacterium]